MKINKYSAVFCGLLLALGLVAQAQDTTYIWTGGAPGYSGTIVLDSPESSHGTLADIISIEIYTPRFGPLSMNLSSGSVFLTDPTFTWNPDHITEMFIAGLSTAPFGNIFVTENSGGGNDLSLRSLLYNQYDVDTLGSWDAESLIPAPDATGTFGLLGFVVVGMSVVSRRLCVHEA
ncbi:MAG TPA: hypothetical protein VH413_12880 [Verrucomicrobiae bacterium]|nr:hypothetical protein [Verrucomicrobiae bacterium]